MILQAAKRTWNIRFDSGQSKTETGETMKEMKP